MVVVDALEGANEVSEMVPHLFLRPSIHLANNVGTSYELAPVAFTGI